MEEKFNFDEFEKGLQRYKEKYDIAMLSDEEYFESVKQYFYLQMVERDMNPDEASKVIDPDSKKVLYLFLCQYKIFSVEASITYNQNNGALELLVCDAREGNNGYLSSINRNYEIKNHLIKCVMQKCFNEGISEPEEKIEHIDDLEEHPIYFDSESLLDLVDFNSIEQDPDCESLTQFYIKRKCRDGIIETVDTLINMATTFYDMVADKVFQDKLKVFGKTSPSIVENYIEQNI